MSQISLKKWYLPLAVVVVLVIGGVAVYAQSNSGTVASSGPVIASPAQPEKPQPTGQPITVSGTVGCLTPSGTGSTQATSCAIGLTGDDGKSYAITSTDPITTGSLPTGSHVQVTGVITQQSTQYDIAGVIQVAAVVRQ